jgi:hypothetical protein
MRLMTTKCSNTKFLLNIVQWSVLPLVSVGKETGRHFIHSVHGDESEKIIFRHLAFSWSHS